MSKFLVESSLKGYLKKYKSAIKYSFMVGLFMGSLPFIYKSLESLRVQKLIQEQRKVEIKTVYVVDIDRWMYIDVYKGEPLIKHRYIF